VPHESELIEAAQTALGSDHTVLAAGVFGLQDDYKAITVGGLASAAVADALPGGATTDALTAAAGIHVTRQVMAENQGLTVRMLVAVTRESIHLFALGATGFEPKHQLLSFSRATTTCEEKKFGASRKLKLIDSASGNEVGLVGSAAFFSPYTEGDKAVLAAVKPGSSE